MYNDRHVQYKYALVVMHVPCSREGWNSGMEVDWSTLSGL